MFQLDARLEKSSFKLADWPLSEVRVKDNAHFPWIILIPRVPETIGEIFQLSSQEQMMLMDEITRLSAIIQSHFKPDKINVGSLGNMVSQMHIHVVARFKKDLCWPHSVWHDNVPEQSYSLDSRQTFIEQLHYLLS